jgi:hypothetical protein
MDESEFVSVNRTHEIEGEAPRELAKMFGQGHAVRAFVHGQPMIVYASAPSHRVRARRVRADVRDAEATAMPAASAEIQSLIDNVNWDV